MKVTRIDTESPTQVEDLKLTQEAGEPTQTNTGRRWTEACDADITDTRGPLCMRRYAADVVGQQTREIQCHCDRSTRHMMCMCGHLCACEHKGCMHACAAIISHVHDHASIYKR